MTGEQFGALALSMPDAVELGHMEHPDYRIGGTIFATRGYPDERFAMLKLTPDEQSVVIAAEPDVFSAAKGAWGRGGSTLVRLEAARLTSLCGALQMACAAARAKASPTSRSHKRGS